MGSKKATMAKLSDGTILKTEAEIEAVFGSIGLYMPDEEEIEESIAEVRADAERIYKNYKERDPDTVKWLGKKIDIDGYYRYRMDLEYNYWEAVRDEFLMPYVDYRAKAKKEGHRY